MIIGLIVAAFTVVFTWFVDWRIGLIATLIFAGVGMHMWQIWKEVVTAYENRPK